MVDDAVDALSSLSSRFLRTVLLMAALAVGIGGLLAALGLTQTAAAQALHLPVPESGVLAPGYRVWIGGTAVDVAGIVRPTERAPTLTTAPLATPAVLTGVGEAAPELVVRTETGFPYPVSQAAPLAIAPEAPGSASVRTVADLRELRAGVADDLGAFVGVRSAVLLVLAVISASTAMYLSVQSRTSEIALRRAIGSSRGLIARVFLLEGTLIGLAGGAVGSAVGTAVILAVSQSRGWAAVLPPTAVPLALALGLAAGVVSALYPAWVASRQRPADALRG
ncbi:FtsX-like permease family protein [Micrococcus sp. HG099]|uniref:ABC transporter permease n=1 Tax=Micrococcus sp. HG099 TaxID=2969755 RepID=UPI0002E4FC87|nr:FtsX-like permease family protein [Micrococcus sp. HG099]MCR8674797.1 FtsX-like permease family protein [Micrococcus sp. HG099]